MLLGIAYNVAKRLLINNL